MKINFGCGEVIKEGYINVDIVKNKGVNKIQNLNKIPYRFESNYAEEILFKFILEHLDNPNKVVKELWRIGKPNAIIKIYVPHYRSHGAWGDITHKRPFSSTSMESFSIKRFKKNYTSLLNKSKCNFQVSTKIYLDSIFCLFEPLVNINNATRSIYERFFSWIIPPTNIKFTMKVIK